MRVLLVEDHAAIREALASTFERRASRSWARLGPSQRPEGC